MLLTLSPFEPFKQNHSAFAPALADFSDLLPETMLGPNASSVLLPHSSAAASPPHPRSVLASSVPLASHALPSAPAASQLKRKRDADDDDDARDAAPVKRQATDADAAARAVKNSSPDLEKKRNKLGYHRTSVACSHCRRRKIRCMVPDNDTTGRCSNCIRLKKDCNFCPVEESGTSRSARPPQAPMGSMQPPAGSPDPINKSNPMMPAPLQIQQRPQPYMPSGVMGPGAALGLYDSPQSAMQEQARWFQSPASWDRQNPMGGDDQPSNYGLAHQPLTSQYSLPPATTQLPSHLSPDLNPHADESQASHASQPYPSGLQLRTDMPWNPAVVASSRSHSYAYPNAMSTPQMMDQSNVPRRAATLPGPMANMQYVASSTPSTTSEPVSLSAVPGNAPQQPLEWQPVEWSSMPAQGKEQHYGGEPYTFNDAGWYHQPQQ